MLASISSFFENYLKPRENESAEDHEHQLRLASAALMIELSRSDHNIDEQETETLVKLLRQRFELSEETLRELMALAEQEVREATDLYQFTTLLNQSYEYPEKLELLSHLWEVAFADGRLDRYEEHTIRHVAELLYISHNDFINTKLAVKDRMA